jgi:NAD(P)-dependent dehydrogenase (short-subunit alcohol dehydrogenase family)
MKTYLITGAASGIGRHLALSLLARGERVCATDINEDALQTLRGDVAQLDNLWLQALDVRDAPAWEALVQAIGERWGGLDVLLNVAGFLKPGYAHEADAEDVHRHLDINTKGVMFGTQAAARHMLPRGRGHIVNIASLAGIAPVPGLTLYSASKFAVRGYSLAAAYELRQHGIKVTVVCPDAVKTPMLDLQVAYEQAALTFSGNRPLTVDEVTDAVLNCALTRAPLEITLSRSRGLLAKVASFFPGLSVVLLNALRRRGLARQKTYTVTR